MAAGFLAEFNRRAREHRPVGLRMQWRRSLGVAMFAVVVVAALVRAPLVGHGFAAPATSQYLLLAESISHGGFPDNLRPPGYSSLKNRVSPPSTAR